VCRYRTQSTPASAVEGALAQARRARRSAVVRTAMERVSVNGGELEFASAGSGEAVLFIHGGGAADTGLPLAVEPAYARVEHRRSK
jgi:hypothetical protein